MTEEGNNEGMMMTKKVKGTQLNGENNEDGRKEMRDGIKEEKLQRKMERQKNRKEEQNKKHRRGKNEINCKNERMN